MGDITLDLWAIDEVHFPATRFPLPDVGAPGNQGPGVAASSHAAQRGILWRRAATRRESPVSSGDRQVQRFFEFMKNLYETSISSGRRVVVITDNAKYHHARLHRQWREEHAAEFMLDYLPAYSPELNPIERVWKLPRRLCLHNRYFPLLQELTTTVETEFAGWARPPKPCADYAQLQVSEIEASAEARRLSAGI